MRLEEIEAIRAVMKMDIERKRVRGRPKKRWLETIKKGMRVVNGEIQRRCPTPSS